MGLQEQSLPSQTKNCPHPRRVGLQEQSLPSQTKNSQPAKAGFVGIAPPFEGAGDFFVNGIAPPFEGAGDFFVNESVYITTNPINIILRTKNII